MRERTRVKHPIFGLSVLGALVLASGCGGGGGGGSTVSAPALAGSTPGAGETLSAADSIAVRFSAPLSAATLGAAVTVVADTGGGAAPVAGTVTLRGDREVLFSPAAPLPFGAHVTVTIDTDLTSTSGRPLAAPVVLDYDVPPASSVSTDANLGVSSAAAVTLADGRVLLTGGKTSVTVADCAIFDPATGAVAATASLNAPRQSHIAVLIDDGKVAVLGGVDGATMVTSVEVFDPAAPGAGWSVRAFTLAPRTIQHAAFRLADGRFILAGGYASAAVTDPQTAIEVLDAALTGVTVLAGKTTTLAGPAVQLSTGDVVLFGRDLAGPTASAEVLDLVAAAPVPADPVVSISVFTNALTLGAESDPAVERFATDDRILVFRQTRLNIVTVAFTSGAPSGASSIAGPALDAARTRTFARTHGTADGSILIGPGGKSLSVTDPVADLYVPGPLGAAGSLIALDAVARRSYASTVLRDGRILLSGGRQMSISSGPLVAELQVFSLPVLATASQAGDRDLIIIGADPRSGFVPVRLAQRTFVLEASRALDPATVTAAAVDCRVRSGSTTTPIPGVTVALASSRRIAVTLPAGVLASGQTLEIEALPVLADLEGNTLDASRGAPVASYNILP